MSLTTLIKFVSAGSGGTGGGASATTSGVATGDIPMLLVGLILALIGGFAAWATISHKKRVTAGAHVAASNNNRIPLPLIGAFLAVLLGLTMAVSGTTAIKAHADQNSLNVEIIGEVNEQTGDVTFLPSKINNDKPLTISSFGLSPAEGITSLNDVDWTVKAGDTIIYEGKMSSEPQSLNPPVDLDKNCILTVTAKNLPGDVAKSLIGKDVGKGSSTDVKVKRYTVQFDVNGGTPIPDSQIVEYGNKVIQPQSPTKSGYTFDNWYSDKELQNKWDFDEDVVNKDTTLYAKWTAITYTATFDVQEHGIAPQSQTVAYGAKVTKPADPTETGYTFGGWYKEATCENAWDFDNDTMPANDMTLYAKWTPEVVTYTVKFNANGGTGTMADQIFTEGVAQKLSKNEFTNEGYTFSGWMSNAGDFYTDEEEITVSDDMTLTAMWT